ncbi:MAG TPA: hypothetical protein VFC47_11255 [Caulobacteraceae bacterium]|nr:hypothetical protein [Caulobacteraceae bacterium]
MAWTYRDSTGEITSPTGAVIGTGYSGNGEGLNNPALAAVEGVGPIPPGRYTIGLALFPVDHLGPCALPLTVVAFDDPSIERSAFFIHGDNLDDDHSASHGCIVAARPIRIAVAGSLDRELIVIP